MKRMLALPVSMMLLGAACTGPSDDPSAGEPSVPADTDNVIDDESAATPSPEVGPADAVVRVVTTGTFVSPDFGQLDSVAGSGSAFVIDETGLAVTNNHVVAGAASVEVFFDGADDPVAASVVAHSECGDLAVIDLAGDGYPALDWSSEKVDAGLGIRAAGYPGGDPGLTLTGGIVARVDDDGATPWASIGSLLRHDAELAPGNSGGPILDDAGQIVGVNVAASDSGRFAIPTSVALPIVDRLRSGTDVDSIGLNAVAVLDEDSNESGVWVVSVEAGSPAADAGIEPGDVITRMKGVRVGTDATLAGYCAVVRSTGDGELPVEVIRGEEFLAGSVRGPTVLSPVLAVTDDVVDTATEPPPVVAEAPPAGTPYESFEMVTDDSATISFDVPTAWGDRRTGPVNLGGEDKPAVSASYDFDALEAATGAKPTYDQAGVAATVFSADVDIDNAFDVMMDNLPWMYDCTPLDRETFDDGVFDGVMRPFMDCAGTPSTVFSIALQRRGEPGWVLINIFAPTVADLDAAVRIASTYTIHQPLTAETDTASSTPETTVEQAPDTTVADAPDTTVERSDGVEDEQLPETVAKSDEVIETIGAPPQAGRPATDSIAGVEVVQYPTTASTDELRAWIGERSSGLGCDDPIEMGPDADESMIYGAGCAVSNGDTTITYALLVSNGPDGLVVTVSVFDLDDGQ